MNRRRFIAAACALAATAAGALGISRLFRKDFTAAAPLPEPPTSEQYGLRDDLRQYYHYLEFDEEVLWAYLADLRKYGHPVSKTNARAEFLLSTDFFANGGDEQRPLRYGQLYDAYITPCYNPMTRQQH
jgi:hypothetical protein